MQGTNTGEGNWDDEVIKFLNSTYPDWKYPSKTHMVPCEFSYRKREPDAGEKTEKMFFDLLQDFGKSQQEGMFVIHSYHFAEMISKWSEGSDEIEEMWKIGEHDFVVIHPKWGFLFFQVKAAVRTVNKFSEADKQLLKDQQSLRAFAAEKLQRRMKRDVVKELFTYPGFVVMPNCKGQVGSVVEPSNGIFMKDCENVGTFSEWWNKNIKRAEKVVKQDLFEFLVMRFVGMAHGIRILRDSIDASKSKLDWCMTEGLKNLLNSPPEQWISGPCGNGKMWLLIEKVQDIAKYTEDSVLVVCFSKPLSMKLVKELPYRTVRVVTFGDLLGELCVCDSTSEQVGKGHVSETLTRLEEGTVQVQRYHHIFVYECEDLDGVEWPTLFKKLCKEDGQEYSGSKHIWFFCDPNTYLSPIGTSLLESLKKGTRLPRVYRNTGNISLLAKKYFVAVVAGTKSLEPEDRIRGPKIEWDGSLTSRDVKEDAGAELILKHIVDLRRNKVADKDICILTENEDVRNDLTSELEKIGIQSHNATDHHTNDEDKVVVESIRQFKELSSYVVVLYNPPFSENETWTKERVKSLLYLAVSSCVCKLVVITTKCGCTALQSEEGITYQIEGSSFQIHRDKDLQAEL